MRWLSTVLLSAIFHAHFVSGITGPGGGLVSLKTIVSDWSNKFKYRKYDLAQYREAISTRVTESIEKFRNDQLEAQNIAQKDLEAYMEKFNQLYAKNVAALERQKLAVEDMTKRMEIKRPPQIDDSLEQFRRFYNESMVVGPYEMVNKQWKFTFLDKKTFNKKEPRNLKDPLDTTYFEENLVKQTEKLYEKLQSDWNSVFKTSTDTKRKAKGEKRDRRGKKTGTIEKAMRTAALDLNKIQEELTQNAKQLAVSTQNSIMNTIDKNDVWRETRSLELQLKKLNREGDSPLQNPDLSSSHAIQMLLLSYY